MRRKPELMQLEIGMSTMRYLPASGTAGLARSLVSGNRRVPCPPPMMTQRTLLMLSDCLPVCDIGLFDGIDITAFCQTGQATVLWIVPRGGQSRATTLSAPDSGHM